MKHSTSVLPVISDRASGRVRIHSTLLNVDLEDRGCCRLPIRDAAQDIADLIGRIRSRSKGVTPEVLGRIGHRAGAVRSPQVFPKMLFSMMVAFGPNTRIPSSCRSWARAAGAASTEDREGARMGAVKTPTPRLGVILIVVNRG